ncbi:hypothetical protein AcW1_005648 [Taiwanofungus camphoratus]|nr:hypothetical protein AcW2_004412 [Antrodia cinnamomea]KAI0933154.1 hypothetical protein AcV7_004709 [Antrodia cinnamomea]KAI0933978.1 hypothetical protein AcV5_005975 [Antrodia cinnamomea]KAI0957174.1 hypothetical protein AcW1_005648 [Antrodia cinnamomea]
MICQVREYPQIASITCTLHGSPSMRAGLMHRRDIFFRDIHPAVRMMELCSRYSSPQAVHLGRYPPTVTPPPRGASHSKTSVSLAFRPTDQYICQLHPARE